MMKERIFKISMLLLVVGLFILVGFKMPSADKVAYVNSYDLYENFQMKEELSVKLQSYVQSTQPRIDSLRLQLEARANALRSVQEPDPQQVIYYERLREEYETSSRNFEERAQQMQEQFTDQIWERINTHLETFGKEQGYDFIYGANGNGAIMYANDAKEITEEATAYINAKYQGE
jgi:outer membrane protein